MASPGVMISRELQITLQLAMTEALNRRHEYVCLEHLLYAMLHDVTTSNILRHCGADLELLKKKLLKYLDGTSSGSPRASSYNRIMPMACSARCNAPRCTRSQPGVLKSMVRRFWSRCLTKPTRRRSSFCRNKASAVST